MNKINTIGKYDVYKLNKKTAIAHAKTIARLADSIPLVNYTEKKILAESKLSRIFHGKWEHSLVVFDQDKPIAVIIGYEREKENNDQYPQNSIYISELAVDENYQRQGLARELVKMFLDFNKSFLHIDGDLQFSIQTNSADWNQHVINLYKSFGFKQIAAKKYDNRTDVVLKLKPN
ncbi:MAG: GNAT family N-acetyltransferase [Patescibacteria group bacterium]